MILKVRNDQHLISRLHRSEFLPAVGKTVNLLPHRNWVILIRFVSCIHTTWRMLHRLVPLRSVKVPGAD